VDGYNLSRSGSLLLSEDPVSPEGREALCSLLSSYARGKGFRLTVVFDGRGGGSAERVRRPFKGGTAIFSSRTESADDAIRGTVARLQANGSSIGPAIHGSRLGSDGEAVEWWTATLPELGPEQPPFLIKHAATGAEWGPAAREERRSFVHPLGSPTRLRGLEIPAPDPIALAAECSRQLGLEFWVTGTSAVSTPGKHFVRLVSAPPARLPLITLGARRGTERRVSAHGVEFSVLGIVA